MLVCPTSLLPICPAGSPTSRPDAEIRVLGHRPSRPSSTGVLAVETALVGEGSVRPKPSMMISAVMGFICLSFAVSMKRVRQSAGNRTSKGHVPLACRQYVFAVSMMAANFSGTREAPPMRPPSMSGWESSSAAFFSFMEPP